MKSTKRKRKRMPDSSCKWCIHSEAREKWNRTEKRIEKCIWCIKHDMQVYKDCPVCESYSEEVNNVKA